MQPYKSNATKELQDHLKRWPIEGLQQLYVGESSFVKHGLLVLNIDLKLKIVASMIVKSGSTRLISYVHLRNLSA